ncbi:MAG: septal ring lytic transglycosylase RlpA family protein [Melioribacteraceae bacterium]|nr:septal ring lytic transglycosylase RlpA family protein [Melioribacteraceae bacterium]MCF8354813.1 septal ring lytic transglycosylase RlpA family protein [Melioribacteraceae bacterium]MCF8394556.1 septal ring lytic transglycosylase RlpA family protein [Melioribacteraceae bacterium]MCF8420215.1 septal ring lytic transglycosylase RlpA family protein [Melioribacteraceae bacterium]
MKWIAFFIAALVMSSCVSVPRFTSKDTYPKIPAEEIKHDPGLTRYNDFTAIESVTGIASFYADKFDGRQTANGETYDMYGLTAAHPDYPFDTVIRVTNLSNGKSIVIRINDRMPKRDDRIIDLSYGCASELDMLNSGITEVQLDILKWGDN